MSTDAERTVYIVGAGPVGALMAIYLARKGHAVSLIERRPDMRRVDISAGRSINLALTARGLRALADVGLRNDVMKICIPMRGRMIHAEDGTTQLQPYGQTEEDVIYAVSRAKLNMLLLDKAQEQDNVTMRFNCRCTGYDGNLSLLRVQDEETGASEDIKADIVLGADGASSAIRKCMGEEAQDFQCDQSFLDYGYKELEIPPAEDGGFRLEKNALHIWPRKKFMMIAIPNTQGSFTATLFYPNEGKESFASLKGDDDVLAFFTRYFADAMPHMPCLLKDFNENPTGRLSTVKCAPWSYGGNVMLMGDAAHAIVPFFAQGMNSGFEDCAIFDDMIDAAGGNIAQAIEEFSNSRKKDTDAIADMAVENFIEMRDSVTDERFLLKKKVGFALEKRWPNMFVPRYAMVVFRPDIPYAVARKRGAVQDELLERLCAGIDTPDKVDWQMAERLVNEMLPPLSKRETREKI